MHDALGGHNGGGELGRGVPGDWAGALAGAPVGGGQDPDEYACRDEVNMPSFLSDYYLS